MSYVRFPFRAAAATLRGCARVVRSSSSYAPMWFTGVIHYKVCLLCCGGRDRLRMDCGLCMKQRLALWVVQVDLGVSHGLCVCR